MASRKLKLVLETLQVTSFDAEPAARQARGTVNAHNPKPDQTAVFATCSTCSWEFYECCTDPHCTDAC